MTTVAVIGLGEAGSRYATGLAAAGRTVVGFDPIVQPELEGVTVLPDIGAAVSTADVVLSLVGAVNAPRVADDVAAHLRRGAVLADLNTADPAVKRTMAEQISAAGARFLDVAVLAPVPRAGVATPLMVSGDGAQDFRRALEGTGADIEKIEGGAGAAAERKLLRSVFMKGLAGVVLEALAGGRAAGCEQWLQGQIERELSGDPHLLVERLVTGSHEHAVRRRHEAADAARCLDALGQPVSMMRGAEEWFARLEPR